MESEKKKELNWNNLPEIAKKALKVVASNSGFVSYDVNIEPGSEIGDGYMSIMLRATIVGTKSLSETLNEFPVLCKMQVANKERREFTSSNALFKREIDFYNDYFPEIEKLQKEFGISENDGFFSYPKCYYAEFDETTNDAILVMKDLRDDNFKLVSKFESAKIEVCELVVKELGKLHAVSFALEHKKPKTFEKFRKYHDLAKNIIAEPHCQELWDAVFPPTIKALNGNHPKIEEKLKKFHKNIMEDFITIVSSENSGKYSVIGHGDSWTNNFLFKFNEEGYPESLKVLDWQLSKYASPILDLAYFLFTATDKETRDGHYSNLLNLYYETFSTLLKKFGENPDEIFSYDDFQREWKKFGRFGLFMALCLINFVTISTDDVEDINEAINEFMNPNKEVGKQGAYMKAAEMNAARNSSRLIDIVFDMERFGYI